MVRVEGLHEEKTAVKKLLHGCSSSSGGNKEMGFRANTCISIVSIRSLTTCINTAMYLSSPGVCFHTLHPFRPVWMLWVPTGETLGWYRPVCTARKDTVLMGHSILERRFP